MEEIRFWIEKEGTGHWFFLVLPVVLLCLFIWFKGRKITFLVPGLLISLVIINPWFYEKWEELGLYAYWRILWVLPVVPIIATVVPSITEMIDKRRNNDNKTRCKTRIAGKSIVVIIGVVLIIFGGTFLYNGTGGTFVEAANIAKLPDNVVQIANRLLELNEHPKVITQDPIGVYIRQYTGNIDTLFGRDMGGYILYPERTARAINEIINHPEGDLSIISQMMLDDGYDYIIIRNIQGEDCFELMDFVGEYGIYKAFGVPKTQKTWNEKGQVIKVVSLDLNGNVVNGPDNNCIVNFDYDDFNNVIYSFRTDINGTGVTNCDGVAGFIREYDLSDHIVREVVLGADGKPTQGKMGYAEVRRHYQDNNLISEEYYDTEGNKTTNLAGYASFLNEYDENKKLISRTYFDCEGNKTNRIDGYAKVDWSNKDIVFYDTDGKTVLLEGINLFKIRESSTNRWSEWMTPTPGMENCCFYIGTINLGDNRVGDTYSCQIDIEFYDVETENGQSFFFRTQGPADGLWGIGNVWDNFVLLTEPLADGIYTFRVTRAIDSGIANADCFDIGFRCDNWKNGSFRVRDIKIEKKEKPSDWSFGI